ncbi:MAG: lantibiotic dehydratase [Alteromonadaceae bacterium]|nr:lantibiotic dehydratase [Alteromonadaceae bacterium]
MNINKATPIKQKIISSNFFVLRFPKQSLNSLFEWCGDEKSLREKLILWIDNAEVKEALYLASPSFTDRIEYWLKDPESKKGKKIEHVLTKYFIRMCSRSTPFGTFSGITQGFIGSDHNLQISKSKFRRKSRLDMLIPFQLKKSISLNDAVFNKVELKANATIYSLNEKIRYIESQSQSTQQLYSLSSVDSNIFVQTAIDQCQEKSTTINLVKSICSLDADITEDDAREFIRDMIDADVLEVVLPISITNSGCCDGFIDAFHRYGLVDEAKTIRDSQLLLANLDRGLGQHCALYREIPNLLSSLPIDVNENTCIQTDLWHDVPDLKISQAFVSRITTDLDDLAGLITISSFINEGLDVFKNRFVERYGGHAVSLLEVLDDENGIGFSNQSDVDTPLIDGIAFNEKLNNENTRWNSVDRLIFDEILKKPQAEEIVLSKKMFKSLNGNNKKQFPASFFVSGSLICNSTAEANNEDVLFYFKGCGGPSSVKTMGRFCHLDEGLLNSVKKELQYQQSCYPEAILAEIVHFPQGKVGNVVARPSLREYEIPFLADASVDKCYQIALKDLQVFVQGNRVVLWSLTHNKEVLPHLSSAHNTIDKSLGIYSFLAALQNQNVSLPHFSLSKPVKNLKYVPRIKFGKLILSARRWKVPYKAFITLLDNLGRAQVDDFRAQYKLPKFVVYKEYDQKLTINLYNILALRALVNSINKNTSDKNDFVIFEESLQTELGSALTKGNEQFHNEVVIPLRNPEFTPAKNTYPGKIKTNTYQAKFISGDQWLCSKIYCGEYAAEEVLINALEPWLTKKIEEQQLKTFFFLRFADPEYHIRLRVQVADQTFIPLLQKELTNIFQLLVKQNIVLDISWIYYIRETQRYGGQQAMLIAEKIFTADSLCALALLKSEITEDVLWKVVIWGCDQLLNDLNFSLSSKLKIMQNLRKDYGYEFNENSDMRLSLGTKFREEEEELQQILNGNSNDVFLQELADIFEVRSNVIRPLVKELYQLNTENKMSGSLERVAMSYLHMFINRMLKGNSRKQELCIYDFLLKIYNKQLYK